MPSPANSATTPSQPESSPRGSSRRRWLACAAGAAITVGILGAVSPPEPDPIPRRWQLDVDVGALRVASIPTEDQGIRSYFYLTYTVTNNSGEDLLFAPAFELVTDHEMIRSGRSVPLAVTKTLLEKTRVPQIEDQISIIGQLLQGKENQKHGLVVWPADELETHDLIVYAAGFSGETATVERPDTNKKVVLRKTLMLRYASPGDLTQNGQSAIPTAQPPRWIMR